VLVLLGGGGSALQHELIEGNAFAFNLAVTILIARKVFGPGRVTAHRVQGAVLLYLNIAALFAIAYNALLGHWPGRLRPPPAAPSPAAPSSAARRSPISASPRSPPPAMAIWCRCIRWRAAWPIWKR
jgi:hypothetical protein